MTEQRLVGGMHCGEVLEVLSEFVDGELEQDESAKVVAHLRGCDWCERFGGSFSAIVSNLRQLLADADDLSPDVEQRLLARLEQDITRSKG